MGRSGRKKKGGVSHFSLGEKRKAARVQRPPSKKRGAHRHDPSGKKRTSRTFPRKRKKPPLVGRGV